MTIYDELFEIRAGSFTINTRPSRVHANFRIFHIDLDPDALTEMFSVEPSRTHKSGDPRIGKRGRLYAPFSKGCWSLDCEDHVDSIDVNDHINWILDEMSSCTGAIHKLQSQKSGIKSACRFGTCGIRHAASQQL